MGVIVKNSIDYVATTLSYYESWLGEQGCLTDGEAVRFIYSNERNIQQLGYPSRCDIYCWMQPNKTVVSYGDLAQAQIDRVKAAVTASHDVADIATIISDVYNCNVNHSVKYMYTGANRPIRAYATTLSANDYGDYKKFFLRNYPGGNADWLQEYFSSMVVSGTCVGVYVDGDIVSCTDGPSMHYMSDKVQELGINTLPGYGGKGYATAACVKAAQNIIATGKVPQWSTTIDNIASQKLAVSAGFVRIADVLTMILDNS